MGILTQSLLALIDLRENMNDRTISGRGRWVPPFILFICNTIDGVENEKKDY